MSISAVLICRNEEKNISDCLTSVKWADEIIVIDAFSSDLTVEIAKQFTDKIFQNEWAGFSAQRKFGLEKCSSEWIFPIDADERCTPELKDEILNIVSSVSISENGFLIPRKSFFGKRWIKHAGWYPGYQMRLFRKSKVIVDDRLVHEKYEVEAPTGKLKNDLLHYTVSSVTEFLTKVNAYSTLQAQEKVNRGKMGFFGILFNARFAFIKPFFIQRGYLDGVPGLIVSLFNMITNILINAKIWEMQNKS